MIIYAIFERVEHTGEFFVSAWSTREKAEEELKKHKHDRYSGFYIEEIELDISEP